MKNILCAATIAFAVVSSLSATTIGGVTAAASAAEMATCQTSLKPVVTGGMAREELAMAQTCDSMHPDQERIQPVSMIQPPTQVESKTQVKDSTYPAYCPTLPSWVEPGDSYYRDAVERCKYGS